MTSLAPTYQPSQYSLCPDLSASRCKSANRRQGSGCGEAGAVHIIYNPNCPALYQDLVHGLRKGLIGEGVEIAGAGGLRIPGRMPGACVLYAFVPIFPFHVSPLWGGPATKHRSSPLIWSAPPSCLLIGGGAGNLLIYNKEHKTIS